MCADTYEPSLISPSRLVATPPAQGVVVISSALWDRLAATLFFTPIKLRQDPTKQNFLPNPAFFSVHNWTGSVFLIQKEFKPISCTVLLQMS